MDRFVVFDAATASLERVGTTGRDRSIPTTTRSSRASASSGTRCSDGRTSVRAAYAVMVDQPVTNVVTPTASNPPLATPLTFAGPIRLENALETATGRPGSRRAPSSPDFQGGRLADVERQRRAPAGTAARRDGRLLRVEGRPPAHLAEHQPAGQRRAAVPGPVGGQPDHARRAAREHRRDRQPRPLAATTASGSPRTSA